MKKIIAVIGALALALTLTGVASAATIDNVSDDSTANIVANWLLSIRMHNTNDAVITNTATATADSGGNVICSDDDQTNTSLTTGDASAAVVVENTANDNSLTANIESPNGGEDDPITNVTDESTATTSLTDEVEEDMVNDNTVDVTNEVSATAVSGDNVVHSEDSLDGASVDSGATDSATGVTNLFNFNVKDIIRAIRSSL